MMLDERVEDLPLVKFTAQDRCDRCGAQAFAEARKDGMSLIFCGHHRKQYADNLLVEGWTIYDDYEAWEQILGENLTPAGSD
jgi:hypothetical protein